MVKYTKTEPLTETEEILETVLSYQGYDEILINNYFRVLDYKYGNSYNEDYITFDTLLLVDDKETPIIKAIGEDVWCMVVAIYGEWGVSLRCGWIEDITAFINLVEHMIIWSDYGVKRNFIERSCHNDKNECCTQPLRDCLKQDMINISKRLNRHTTISNLIENIK